MKHIHVAGERHQYCAWPSVTRTPDGTILVSYCRSEEHMGPDGEIQVVRSTDECESWSSPIVVRDSLIDDREGGMTRLSDGRVLAHVWSTFHTPDTYKGLPSTSYRDDVMEHWSRHTASVEYQSAADEHGSRIYQSKDHGLTWTDAGKGPDSIHGGIELASGKILVAGYRSVSPNIALYLADPQKLEWERITLYKPPAMPERRFGEPHIVQLPSGRVVMMLRSTAIPYDDSSSANCLWTTWSDDEGRTWSEALPTDLLGFPPHLCRLADGRILCSYGRRCSPYGERACISDDGITWDARRERVLRDDADGGDLGYPASMELEPGRILTVYYQSPYADPPVCMKPPDPLRRKPDIMGTIWELD